MRVKSNHGLRYLAGLVVCLFLACGQCVAAPLNDAALETLLRDAPTAKDYPREPAVWLLREMDITVSPDGATIAREHYLLKLLTEQALSQANWEIPYDKVTEKLEVHTARTLLHDQAYAVDPAQVAESSVYPGLAWYDSLVMRRFPLPAAVTGATLEVKTTTHRPTPRVPGEFSTRLHLQQPYPIREARYIVRAPAAMPLTFRFAAGEAPKVEERVEGGHRVYRWTLRNVPALRADEPLMPPYADICHSARISSLAGWQPIAAWYRQLTAGKDALTEELRAVATRLTADCDTPAAQVASLHQAVSQLPYVALEMGNLSDVPHPAADVLRHNYGDCKDKATLLKALLQAVGIESHYVLVRTTNLGALDRQLFSPAEFNHVILAARLGDGDHFLDATIAGTPWHALPPNVDGAEGLIVRGDGELVTLPAMTAEQNSTDIRVTIAVNADHSARGTATLTFRGQLAMLQRGMLLPVDPGRYREALEETLAARLGADITIDAVDIANLQLPALPLVVTAHFSSPAYLQAAGPNLSGMLPVFAYQANPYRTVKERRHPFLTRMATGIHLQADITLPEGLTVVSVPAPAQYDGPIGSYRDKVTVEGRTLAYTCHLIVKRGTLPPAELENVRAWASLLALEKRNWLQFFVSNAPLRDDGR